MPSRQDALRRMRFDQMLKKKDPEMYERYQEERLENRKRKERADYPPDARPKKFKVGGANISRKKRKEANIKPMKKDILINRPPQEEIFEEIGPLEGTIKPMKYESGGEAEMKKAAKKARLRRLAREKGMIDQPETQKMIEDFQNDRSPIFDRRMYDQPESEGGDPKKMKTGGMTCPHRPDGIRGVGKAIKGFKYGGCK